MTLRIDLEGVVNNDLLYFLQATYKGVPFDLTGVTASIVAKASATALDNTGTTYTTSNGLTILTPKVGKFSWAVPRASNTVAGTTWWRCDLNVAGDIATCFEGQFIITPA